MRLVKFLSKTVVGIAAATAVVAALPVLGAVGTVSAAGAGVAAVVGTGAAIVDHIKEEKDRKEQKSI